jgi:asparagine synthase (glutamine-hydrolysing)
MTSVRGHLRAPATFAAFGDPAPPPTFAGCRVLVRGYLADRADLRARLGVAAHGGDAELLAHAFRRWGPELQAHVCGEFAAAIWDVRAKTALLTHDALGLCTLFYAERPGGVAFAGELEDLIDADSAGELDEEYLADFLVHGVATGARTPYRAIRRLLPGRSLWWSGGTLRELHTWNLAGIAPVACRDDAEYDERFRALLRAGVSSALEDGPAWISLSGGLDSSSIAAMAAPSGGSTVGAYSVVSPRWPEADERPWMRAVVERYDLPWYTQDVELALPFSVLPTGFYGEPTPAIIDESHIGVTNELMRSHGVSALLTGDGGDTVLGAAPGTIPVHLADALFDGDPLSALRAVAGWKKRAHEQRSSTYWLLRALAAPSLAHVRGVRVRGSERLRLPPWLASEYAERTGLERRLLRRVAPRCRQPGRQATSDGLWFCGLATSAASRRRRTYDFRAPLLYRPLVEFMVAIPWEQKLRPRCDRFLQRRALAGILPELVRRRAGKAVGTAAFVEGLRRSRDWFGYLTDESALAERGMVVADRWRTAVRQAAVGHTGGDRSFLAAVALEAWFERLAVHREALSNRPDLRSATAV